MSIDSRFDPQQDHPFELYGLPFVLDKQRARDGLPKCRIGLAALPR